jgi:uncharacterized CHY-type Zn-finger protein
MCKHILNVQAAIRSTCCLKWFDCADCHNEMSDHPLKKTNDITFMCKVCKKAFRKDMIRFEGNSHHTQRPMSTAPTAIISTSSTPSPRKIADTPVIVHSPSLRIFNTNTLIRSLACPGFK